MAFVPEDRVIVARHEVPVRVKRANRPRRRSRPRLGEAGLPGWKRGGTEKASGGRFARVTRKTDEGRRTKDEDEDEHEHDWDMALNTYKCLGIVAEGLVSKGRLNSGVSRAKEE
jgi:hypothetical protein